MSEIILHHYATSPFSEKIRKILAYKRLSWRGVEQPMFAPKPKLTPLTGGYRKIPVLQIGADVFCDTAVIAHEIEKRHPEPSCLPAGSDGAAEMIAYWADHRFFFAAVPPVIVDLLPTLPAEFMADRQAMSPGFTVEALKAALPDARSQLVVGLDWLDRQLRRRKFVLGDSFSVADAACFHCVWFLRNDPNVFALAEKRAAVREWFERIDAMGTGDGSALDPDEALAIAERARPMATEEDDGTDPNGLRPGDRVAIVPDDYGTETVRGTLVRVTAQELAVRRDDEEIGEVVVHFPRSGFRVSRV